MQSPPRAQDPNARAAAVAPPVVTDTMPGALPDAAPWTGSWRPLITAWLVGVLILAGLLVFVLHFGAVEVFVDTLKRASPGWIALAMLAQAATYAAAAAVWLRMLHRAGAAVGGRSLFGLAFVELFANQAIPSGGLSGSVMMLRGLMRRNVAEAAAITSLLIVTLAYYAAYVLVAVAAFVLLWHSGDLSTAWQELLLVFLAVLVVAAIVVVILARARANFVPNALRRWPPVARLASLLGHVRVDLLRDPMLIAEAIGWQVLIFVLDAVTLWATGHAVGLSVGLGGSFTSFVLASVAATVSPMPLGLGSFEGSCTALLHLMGGGLEASLAATLLLRGLTLWLPMLPGLWLIRREAKHRAKEGATP